MDSPDPSWPPAALDGLDIQSDVCWPSSPADWLQGGTGGGAGFGVAGAGQKGEQRFDPRLPR